MGNCMPKRLTQLVLMAPQAMFFSMFLALVSFSKASDHVCSTNGFPLVRNISEMKAKSFGLPGMSHITLAGAVLHGFKEVEVWLETVAPGTGTPIHRHDCEEVFVILKGSGTIFLSDYGEQIPATPIHIPFSANSTFHIPPNHVHQVINTDQHQDLQALVVISRAPLKPYLYDEWTTPHSDAKLMFPFLFDAECYKPSSQTDNKHVEF